MNASVGTWSARAWAGLAVGTGVIAGVIAAGASDPVRLVLALVALLVAAVTLYRYEVGVVLMIGTLSLDIYGRVISSPVVITVFHLMLLLTLLSWALALLTRKGERLRFSAVDVGMGALVAAALWSLPNSLSTSATTIAIVRLVALWAFTLLYANATSKRVVAQWTVAALVATGVGSALLAAAQYALPSFAFGSIRMINEGGGVYLRRVGALFDDPNFFATFLSVAFIAAAVMFVHSRSWKSAAVWAGSAVVLLGGIAVSFSRTALVGVAVAMLVLIATAPKARRKMLLIASGILVAVVLVAAPAQLVDRITSIGEVGYNNSNATRYYMVGSTVEIAQDYWVYGTGLAAFDQAYPPYRRLGSLSSILKPHQLPLAMVAEMGVAGLLAEIALIVGVTMALWRRRPQGWGRYEALAVVGLTAVMVQSLFQYYLYFEYLWLLVAFAASGPRLALQEESDD